MTPALKHRWFRYSLRTLFVVVTLFACWLAYSLTWVRQRHEFLSTESPQAIVFDGEMAALPPGMLWILNEQGVGRIIILSNGPASSELVRAAKRLFPEAELLCRGLDED
jgi:hypothetical protein